MEIKINNWTVRIVRKGDRYGLRDVLVHDGDEPMVEFYDARWTERFGPRGQFASRYYVRTLAEHGDYSGGLDLHGGVPDWDVTGAEMAAVMGWLRAAEQVIFYEVEQEGY